MITFQSFDKAILTPIQTPKHARSPSSVQIKFNLPYPIFGCLVMFRDSRSWNQVPHPSITSPWTLGSRLRFQDLPHYRSMWASSLGERDVSRVHDEPGWMIHWTLLLPQGTTVTETLDHYWRKKKDVKNDANDKDLMVTCIMVSIDNISGCFQKDNTGATERSLS